MINYSVFTGEFVLESEEKIRERKIIEIGKNIKLLVEKTEKENEHIILQVLSTDPQVYLRSELNPGTIIKNI